MPVSGPNIFDQCQLPKLKKLLLRPREPLLLFKQLPLLPKQLLLTLKQLPPRVCLIMSHL